MLSLRHNAPSPFFCSQRKLIYDGPTTPEQRSVNINSFNTFLSPGRSVINSATYPNTSGSLFHLHSLLPTHKTPSHAYLTPRLPDPRFSGVQDQQQSHSKNYPLSSADSTTRYHLPTHHAILPWGFYVDSEPPWLGSTFHFSFWSYQRLMPIWKPFYWGLPQAQKDCVWRDKNPGNINSAWEGPRPEEELIVRFQFELVELLERCWWDRYKVPTHRYEARETLKRRRPSAHSVSENDAFIAATNRSQLDG